MQVLLQPFLKSLHPYKNTCIEEARLLSSCFLENNISKNQINNQVDGIPFTIIGENLWVPS